jgi:topoisomerase-4 subunit A
MSDMLDAARYDEITLHTYTENAYLDYAVAVVKGRALGQVQDGQKPVQRRILYAMHQLGLRPDAKPVKSARIVGDVLGKYHPHGDSSVYDAAVRMAQDFSLRYPLITGQGNYGSRDGDPAAAMRYTEARLSPYAQLLLAELGSDTVDFGPNYDNTMQEPLLLPARLPMLLLNGTMGIAVGMASDVPPHNLREVAAAAALIVRNPDATDAEILEVLPGPDFPDGAQLVSSPAEIAAAYASGRGSMRARARWTREDMARGQWQIVVTELPYQISTTKVLQELEVLTNPQPPEGKKVITPGQATLKAAALEFLERAVDESNKDQPTRLVLQPRSSKVDQDAMMAFLLANTSLETNVTVNMTMIGLDGRPQTKSLRQVLLEWSEFRMTTVRRRTAHELKQAEARIHILEGRLKAYDNLDEVVNIVRHADNPLTELCDRLGFTEVQAEDILEMRMRSLNKLEGAKLERELADLRKEAARLQKLLAAEPLLRKLVVEEIEADAVKYGDDRRTLIKSEAKAASGAAAAIARAAVDEPVTVVLSKNYFIKAYKGHDVSADQLSFKPGDGLLGLLRTRTTLPVLLLDNMGRAYTVDASQLPSGRGEGVPVTTLIELQAGARIVHALGGVPSSRFLFAGENGYGFVAKLENLVATRRAGKAFLTVDAGETPLAPVALPEGDDGLVLAGSSDGRLLAFPLSEVKSLAGGGKGVMLMVLDEGQKLAALAHQPGLDAFEGVVDIAGTATPVALGPDEFKKYVGRRARKGCQLPKKGVLLLPAVGA